MMLSFAKMHGLGNDFLVLDAISQDVLINELNISELAHRHRGVGFDQLLLIESPKSPHVDFNYRIFNADGSEVEQCGNGARCFAHYVKMLGLTWKQKIKVSTKKGLIRIKYGANDSVSVNMGVAQWEPEQIPIATNEEQESYSLDTEKGTFEVICVSMGNPHAIVKVSNVDDYDVSQAGKAIAEHPFFPEGVNVNFLEVIDDKTIKLRVFERGVGETLACGSGACASVIVGRKKQWLDAQVTVQLKGGSLSIHAPAIHKPIHMSGPAEFVFFGQIEL